MIILTLIQTSQNRQKELKRFIDSLNNQINIQFDTIQLIFIDQENNKEIFASLNPNIEFTYIAYKHCSLSHARNLGLKYVKGKYIGFPDDDCWYEANTLNMALHHLQINKYNGVTGKGCNEYGELTSIFPQNSSKLTLTKRCAAISYTLFFEYTPNITFDENIGVGSPYNLGAGEETDYLLTLMEKCNYKVFYDSNLIIHHPKSKDSEFTKIYSYARGSGYILKKHHFSLLYKFINFIRPLSGCIIYSILLKKNKAKKSYYIFKGKIEGYTFKIQNQ